MADTMNLDEFADYCQDLANRLGADIDLSEPMREVEQLLVEQTRDNIENCHAPDGTPWPDLAESTIKEEGGQDRKPLQGMLDYVESSSDAQGVAVGISHPSSVYHQEGTRTIPARPMVGVTDRDADKVAEIIADHIRKVLDGKR